MSSSLFKFIFYLIIIIFWTLNNARKLNNRQSNSPVGPKQPLGAFKKPVPKPASLQPEKQEIFDLNAQADVLPDVSMMPYDQILEMRREKVKARKDRQLRKKPAPEAVSVPDEEKPDKEPVPAIPLLKEEIKKPTLILKSSIKEGIIWSIILGPPRSRERFNWKGSAFQR
ncbi:MAG: hypothetical protein V1739_07570 [Candidatus Omnitrophota bacterium]